jgi:hypothetical protein
VAFFLYGDVDVGGWWRKASAAAAEPARKAHNFDQAKPWPLSRFLVKTSKTRTKQTTRSYLFSEKRNSKIFLPSFLLPFFKCMFQYDCLQKPPPQSYKNWRILYYQDL